MISTLMYGAKSLWWMSEKQQDTYLKLFPFLSERDNIVLSSVFDDQFFAAVKFLKEQAETVERKGWVVLGSNSWVKGTQSAIEYCQDNELEFDVISGLEYGEVLQKLSTAEGFVYLPAGADTCPRMVIEAKLLGCKLHINEYVQHAHELWFDTDDSFDTEAYLYAARERFWNAIVVEMNYVPTISGYTTSYNCIKNKYPFYASIRSMLGFCDEGKGGQFIEEGNTSLGGRLPVNLSGGLVSKGHPVGATGLSMVHELCIQLKGEAQKRQSKMHKYGMAENGGGVMGFEEAACSVIILESPF